MVVHNEEGVIERCLRSCADLVDEIIVLHDGPAEDKTLEIARTFGAQTHEMPRHGSAEAHRISGFRLATGDWILQIDADEFLSENLRSKLRGLVEDQAADAYEFRWPVWDKDHYVGGFYGEPLKMALLRKSKMYMVGITHEFPKTHGALVRRVDLTLEHEPLYRNNTWNTLRRKWFKWSRIQARQIVNLPDAPTFQVPQLEKSWEYGFYKRELNRPFLLALKYSYNATKGLTAYNLQHPRYWFDLFGWKSLSLQIVNYYYLAWYILKFSKDVPRAKRWWAHA